MLKNPFPLDPDFRTVKLQGDIEQRSFKVIDPYGYF